MVGYLFAPSFESTHIWRQNKNTFDTYKMLHNYFFYHGGPQIAFFNGELNINVCMISIRYIIRYKFTKNQNLTLHASIE